MTMKKGPEARTELRSELASLGYIQILKHIASRLEGSSFLEAYARAKEIADGMTTEEYHRVIQETLLS